MASLSPDAAVEQAIAALRTADPKSALPAVEMALKSAPDDLRLWHLKGLIHREDDRRELAIPALRKAAQLAPSHPLIAHGLAATVWEAGLPAVELFAHVMRLTPNDPAVVQGMVAALVAERRIGDAIEGLTRALANSPRWAEGHALLADLRWRQGERDGFARSFDEALQRFPRDLELRRQQLITLLHAEHYDVLLSRISEGRAQLGEQPLFIANEAIVYAERGETALADAAFNQLVGVTDAVVDVRRVRHLLRANRPEEASGLVDDWLTRDGGQAFWPYASVAWRITGDDRWHWLEERGELVGVHDIAARLPSLDELAAKLRALHTARGQPLVQSVRGGTQTDGNLFHSIDPVIVRLREAIRATIAEHIANFPTADEAHPTFGRPRSPIHFSGAWSVRLKAGGFHSNHVHPMGWISSALYILLPPDLGQDRAGWLTLGDPRSKAMPLDIEPLRTIGPQAGRLVLFPSWMWHGTLPFGEGERMTVAFDVAVPGASSH